MNPFLILGSMLLSACAGLASGRVDASGADPMTVANDPFPIPKSGITLTPGKGDELTLEKVLDEYQRATGVHVIVSPQVGAQLAKTTAGISQPLDVPAARVYPSIESLLLQHGFVLTLLQAEPPILLGVESVQNLQPSVRFWSPPAEDTGAIDRHPALMMSVTIHLSRANVREIVNSMRQVMQDPRMQQIIPIGNSNSILISGPGGQVGSIVRMLRAADESAGEAAKSGQEGEKAPK